MHPIIGQWWGMTLYSFGLLVSLGVLAGLGWATVRARSAGLPALTVMELTAWSLVLAFMMAKVTYWIFFPTDFWRDPWASVVATGGLVWYGGLIGALVALPLLLRWQKLPVLLTLDVLAPPTLLGLAIGRVGCLMAGCCYGGPTFVPWAVFYPPEHPTHGIGVHPAPLYESLGALVVMAVLLTAQRHPDYRHGWLTGGLLIGYGLLRFGLESLRGDRLVWLEALNLSASQVVSLLMLGAGILLLLMRVERLAPEPDMP